MLRVNRIFVCHKHPVIDASRSLDYGLMTVINTTFAFFNDVCRQHDVAFQTSQTNNFLQFPIRTGGISQYNNSESNLVYNGLPNIEAANDRSCRGE